MESDQDDDELTALAFARHYGLCRPYDEELLPICDLPAPYVDDFDQNLGMPSVTAIDDAVSTLTKERLMVNKEAALLLKDVHDLQENLPVEPQPTAQWKRTRSLKQEVPLLRTDNDVDLLNFGRVVAIDFRDLKIPCEVVDEANDEGFQWPAKYLTYPAQVNAQIKAEKLVVSKDVLLYLQDILRDSQTPEDFEKLRAESFNYEPNTTRQPITPPLLPLSPPLTPYVPSSPSNRLPLASDSSDGLTLEAKDLERQIMNADALIRWSSDSDDSMLLDITSPSQLSPFFDKHEASISKRKAEDLKVETPLTPPTFSTSPLKKLKTVSFKDLHELCEFWPGSSQVKDERNNGRQCLESNIERDLKILEPFAQQVNMRVENEKLAGADTTVRVDVPNLDFTLPVAPWDEFSQRIVGKYGAAETELSAQAVFLLKMKREDLRGAETWRGVSTLNRTMHQDIFTTKISKINLDEKLHGETDLSTFLSDATSGNIAISSTQVWKPDGLRLLDDDVDDDEIELADVEEQRDVEALIRKRRLELEEEAGEARRKRALSQAASQDPVNSHLDVLGSQSWRGNGAVARTSATDRFEKTQREKRRLPTSPARHKTVRITEKATSDLMFGGFSATTALHKFMETRGKEVTRTSTQHVDSHKQSQNAVTPAAMTLSVRSREASFGRIGLTTKQSTIQTECTDDKDGSELSLRPYLPPVPDNFPPCSFIVSSAFFLQKRFMTKEIQELYPRAEIVYRDYDLPHSPAKEADMILSPSTGLVLTTLQQIKQTPLPGQPDRSSIKERMSRLQYRYERLVVLVSEGLSREMEKQALGRPEDPQSAAALARLKVFAERLEGNVITKYVGGGEEAMTRTIVVEMAKYGLPHGSRDTGDNKPLEAETTWEVFLRRAGLNPFAAQMVVASLKGPCDLQLPMGTSSPTSSSRPDSVPVFGLQAFLAMTEEQRVKDFQALMGGGRILERVSQVLDQQWLSAAHGFRM
ncbi:hypothetical protein BKA63DRAFT_545557 [Paraphoma chrysanthemicola]|nr:hypothetical protein BKA63DRAFT_545557 [Paraphoma chrysanthemicola]